MLKNALCGWPASNVLNCLKRSMTSGSSHYVTKMMLVMRLTIILLTAAMVQVYAEGLSQTVSFTGKNVSLQEVLSAVKKQTGFSVAYNKGLLDKANPISLNVKDVPLANFLQLVFKNQPLYYSIKNTTIGVFNKIETSNGTSSGGIDDALLPVSPITGRVLSEDGAPLAGVTVTIKGSKTASAITDANGNFKVNVNVGDVLVFTYVSYESTQYKISAAAIVSSSGIAVTLKRSDSKLNEVVVNKGYYTESKRFSTGNVASVKAADIEKQPVNNILLALQGRVPGLEITQSNGIPGSGVRFRIQGKTSLEAFVEVNPLIVVDGVPYPAQNLGTVTSGISNVLGGSIGEDIAGGSPLAFLNPADIESIDILKDADATAIYGSRAASGAILITTKKAKPGETKVDVSVEQGIGQVPRRLKLLNTAQYLEMRNEAKRNNHADILSSDYDLNGTWDTTRYTDWQKEMIGGTAKYTRLSASVSGGTKLANYRVSGTYGKETTVFPGDFANTKGSIQFNVNGADRQDRFQLSLTGSFMLDKNEIPGKDFTEFIFLAPDAPALRNADGTLNWQPDASGNSSWLNPLSYNEIIFDNKSYAINTNLTASYKILPNLSFRANIGFNQVNSDQFLASLDGALKPESRGGFRDAIITRNTTRSWISEPQLNYSNKKFLGGRMEALLGASFQEKTSEGLYIDAYGQSSDQLLRNLAAATGFYFRPIMSLYRYSGIFGRFSYIGKERYILNLTARRDGSSRFGSNNHFANFWSIGAGWIFSEENFFKNNISWVSSGKLRGSYGLMGNDQIGDYQFMSLYNNSSSDVPYQGIRPLIGGLSNPDIQWEESRKLQVGLDLGIINDRVIMGLTWYRNRSGNSLTTVPLPAIAGAETILTNFAAVIENSGWELTITSTNIKTKNFTWTSAFNTSRPRNKLVAYPDLANSPYANDLKIGQPLSINGTNNEFKYYGVDPLTGRYLLVDSKGGLTTTPSDPADRTVRLNYNQTFAGGLQNDLQYKGLQLGFFLRCVVQKGYDFLQTTPTMPGVFDNFLYKQNQPTAVLDRWQKPGDQTTYARFTTASSGFIQGDRAFKTLPYLRLQNVSISYQFPTQLIKNTRIKSLRVFAHGQNLYTWTNYQGLDAETKNVFSLPPLRMITIGGNIGF